MANGRSGYAFDAERYKHWSRPQKEWGALLIEQMALQGQESVLDIGCGDGLLTARIAELLPAGRAFGIDSSSTMIEEAGKLTAENVQFMVLDASRMRFEEEFTVAFSNAALHWVTDHRNLLARVHAALLPEGRMFFNFAADGNCASLFRVVREEIGGNEFGPYFKDFAWPWFMPVVEEYGSWVKEAGFKDVRVTGRVADQRFTLDELVNWIEQPSIVPLMEHLREPTMKQRFRDKVVARMVEETRQPDGSFFEAFRRINVVARK